MFQGVFTALVTPMDAQGNFDTASFKKLLDYQLQAGIHGLVPMGTTGESATFPDDVHCQIVAETVRHVNGRVPVIAGCGSNDTAHFVHLAQEIEKTGADALLAVTPYYNRPNAEGLYQHFAAVARVSKKPIILYNVPPRTGTNMSVEVIGRLARDFDNIIGIKDAVPGEITRTIEIHQQAGRDFCILSGEDVTTAAGYALGMVGTISVTSNVAPALMVACYDAWQAEQRPQFLDLCHQLYPLHQGLFMAPNPIPTKAALKMMNIIADDMLRLPLVPLAQSQREYLQKLLQQTGLVSA